VVNEELIEEALAMKIYAFEEITYPGLPTNLGPEVRITNRYCSPQLVVQHYKEHLAELAQAEDYGFDGIFVNEHHFTASNNNPDCNLTAAILIDRTRNCRVGVVGNIIALRHPLAVAEEFAMLDCLSGGRFIPGIVRGLPAEWVSYNMDPFAARKRFSEAYHIIHAALSRELVDYEGEFWNIAHASIWPRPVQDPLPPFWMPAGSLESIRFAAENRLVACQTLQPTSVLKQCFDEYRRIAAADFGWKPGFANFTGLRFMHLGEDHDTALREGSAMFSYLMLALGRPVLNPAPLPGFNTDESYKHRRPTPKTSSARGSNVPQKKRTSERPRSRKKRPN
jgi:alkanesulfonate monooxygenase SsuD/methylene tetrahydromethanopterin reductase-like flavin-dependent oxidoreductase (luciferase family)